MNKHILIIRLSSFGDVAMTVPVVSILRKKYPDIKITVLTTEFYSILYNQVPDINFIFFKEKHRTIRGLHSLSIDINRLKVDHIIDLHNVIRTKLLRFFLRMNLASTNSHFILDKGRNEKKNLIKGSTLTRLKSMHERYAEVFSELSISLDLDSFRFFKKIDISSKNYEFNSRKKLIGIAPFAKHTSKEYSISKILKIIDKLNDSFEILIFGGPAEKQKIEEICKSKKHTFNISSNYSLEEQMSIISNLDIMISMDSANGHIASLFGINVITIWGSTHPFTGYSPFMQPDINAIIPDKNLFPKLPVSIYGSNCPKDYVDAINSIKIDDILHKMKAII
ncbi:MAG: glycosyltransferase family 9 protein [Candidatus Neomarinimicrobiota bacterium]